MTDISARGPKELINPANTCKSTKWAVKVFELWKQARSRNHPEDPVPDELQQVSQLP